MVAPFRPFDPNPPAPAPVTFDVLFVANPANIVASQAAWAAAQVAFSANQTQATYIAMQTAFGQFLANVTATNQVMHVTISGPAVGDVQIGYDPA